MPAERHARATPLAAVQDQERPVPVNGALYFERIANLHVHSVHSDGTGDVETIARAASQAGVDVVFITDHNVVRSDLQGWYGPTLVLAGEELHRPERPHENHLLVLGAREDLAPFADTLQSAISAARHYGGLPIIAHPVEHSGDAAHEPEIDWTDRGVDGLHGLEVWNYMSEFKSHIHTLLHGLLYAFAPDLAIRGPYPETMQLWDSMLQDGIVYAYGSADAHANQYRLGPLRRTILPYRHLFSAVNTHLLLARDWTGDVAQDAAAVHEALAQGRSFIGYDRPAATKGARFEGERDGHRITFGGRLAGSGPAWLRVSLPGRALVSLLHNGTVIHRVRSDSLEIRVSDPGVYRFEAWRSFRGRRVGWVFSNPVWIT